MEIETEDLKDACPGEAEAITALEKSPKEHHKRVFREEGEQEENKEAPEIYNCPFLECSDPKKSPCDIRMFLSWTGTDKYGKALFSVAHRFLYYKNYNLQGMFQSIKGLSNLSEDKQDEILKYEDQIDEIIENLEARHYIRRFLDQHEKAEAEKAADLSSKKLENPMKKLINSEKKVDEGKKENSVKAEPSAKNSAGLLMERKEV